MTLQPHAVAMGTLEPGSQQGSRHDTVDDIDPTGPHIYYTTIIIEFWFIKSCRISVISIIKEGFHALR